MTILGVPMTRKGLVGLILAAIVAVVGLWTGLVVAIGALA